MPCVTEHAAPTKPQARTRPGLHPPDTQSSASLGAGSPAALSAALHSAAVVTRVAPRSLRSRSTSALQGKVPSNQKNMLLGAWHTWHGAAAGSGAGARQSAGTGAGTAARGGVRSGDSAPVCPLPDQIDRVDAPRLGQLDDELCGRGREEERRGGGTDWLDWKQETGGGRCFPGEGSLRLAPASRMRIQGKRAGSPGPRGWWPRSAPACPPPPAAQTPAAGALPWAGCAAGGRGVGRKLARVNEGQRLGRVRPDKGAAARGD